jgi:glycosyltransferase involved in cell wall biosynthesis
MMRVRADGNGRPGRALFVQATEPAAYPPLIRGSSLLAEAGWEVTFLSAPIIGMPLMLDSHPRIAAHAIPARPSHVMGKAAYARYIASAAALAMRVQPHVVYASDPLGAAPGLLAAQLSGAHLVYHEHDSPAPDALRPWLARLRATAARTARFVIFPNENRARIADAELGLLPDRLRIVWNVPRRAEVPPLASIPELPLIVYYHGSITPDRLPEAAIAAVRHFGGRVRLRIVGYEAPGAPGYISRLEALARMPSGEPLVEYIGQLPRVGDLLQQAARAHVGLALMPRTTDDLNMHNMVGASNKAFDYMAAGLALLVSDLFDWRQTFAAPGFARVCNPTDEHSLIAELRWFLDHPAERRTMAARGRSKVAEDWNYDTAFAPIMAELSATENGLRAPPSPAETITCRKDYA